MVLSNQSVVFAGSGIDSVCVWASRTPETIFDANNGYRKWISNMSTHVTLLREVKLYEYQKYKLLLISEIKISPTKLNQCKISPNNLQYEFQICYNIETDLPRIKPVHWSVAPWNMNTHKHKIFESTNILFPVFLTYFCFFIV